MSMPIIKCAPASIVIDNLSLRRTFIESIARITAIVPGASIIDIYRAHNALRRAIFIDLTITEMSEGARWLEVATLKWGHSVLLHEEVRERVVPHASRVRPAVQGTQKMPHQFDATLIVLAIILGRTCEHTSVGVPALKIGCINVEVQHSHIIEHAYGEITLE